MCGYSKGLGCDLNRSICIVLSEQGYLFVEVVVEDSLYDLVPL